MLETITVALTKARRRGVLALAVGTLAILPVLLCACKGQPETESSDSAGQQSTASGDAAAIEAIERIAGELPFLVSMINNHLLPDSVSPEELALHNRLVDELFALDVSTDALISLLQDDDPQLRMLAIGAIQVRDDPSVLPHLVRLLDDTAECFRTPPSHHSSLGMQSGDDGSEWRSITVGKVARSILARYLRSGGYDVNYSSIGPIVSDSSGYQEAFDAYWPARADRAHCAGWSAAKLDRETRGRSPARDEFAAGARRVRIQVDTIPGDDRAWTLLWLYGEKWDKVLVSEAELVELCQQLGPEKLLWMLRNEIPSDDPDLQPRQRNNYRYERMARFVLQHAEELFEPSHAQALSECEQLHSR